MKRMKLIEDQIMGVLKDAEAGATPGMIVSDNVLGREAAVGKGQQVSLRRS